MGNTTKGSSYSYSGKVVTFKVVTQDGTKHTLTGNLRSFQDGSFVRIYEVDGETVGQFALPQSVILVK